jgi:dTDP-4-amino-4,6-dideoxygalactose transaminase
MVKFLDLNKQYQSIQSEIDAAISQVIAESAFIKGRHLEAFEAEFAQYQQAAHCIGVGNGTDALEIAIEALDLPPASEIIIPANSFIASGEAVTRSGHRVCFCDCDAETYTMDMDDLAQRITPTTSAIMAVHLYGHPCDMDAILSLAKTHGLKVIEDCAQAHGAEYRGRRVGSIGDVGTFSFFPGKNLGAYGDGGGITTNDSALAGRCRMIANHGRLDKYDHQFEGRNSRLDGLQSAILRVKLKYLDLWTEARIAVADGYLERLQGCGDITLPKRRSWARQVYHLFVIRTGKQEALREHLGGLEIQTGIHYPKALPKLQAYRYLGQHDATMRANRFDSTLLSLPIGEHMEAEDLTQVIQAIRSFSGWGQIAP